MTVAALTTDWTLDTIAAVEPLTIFASPWTAIILDVSALFLTLNAISVDNATWALTSSLAPGEDEPIATFPLVDANTTSPVVVSIALYVTPVVDVNVGSINIPRTIPL